MICAWTPHGHVRRNNSIIIWFFKIRYIQLCSRNSHCDWWNKEVLSVIQLKNLCCDTTIWKKRITPKVPCISDNHQIVCWFPGTHWILEKHRWIIFLLQHLIWMLTVHTKADVGWLMCFLWTHLLLYNSNEWKWLVQATFS